MQRRIQPTMHTRDLAINDDQGLEQEADVMGTKAVQSTGSDHVWTRSRSLQRRKRAKLGGNRRAEAQGRTANTAGRHLSIQRRPIKAGFGSNSPVIWDTEWASDDKEKALEKLNREQAFVILSRLNDIEHQDYLQILDNFKEDLSSQFADTLFSIRQYLEKKSLDHKLMTLVVSAIQGTLQKSDTKGALPQKKTPLGQTRIMHMNYVTAYDGKINQKEHDHFMFFAENAIKLGLRLEILTTESGKKILLN